MPLLPQRLFGLGPKKPSPGPDFGRDSEEQEVDSWEDDDAEGMLDFTVLNFYLIFPPSGTEYAMFNLH